MQRVKCKVDDIGMPHIIWSTINNRYSYVNIEHLNENKIKENILYYLREMRAPMMVKFYYNYTQNFELIREGLLVSNLLNERRTPDVEVMVTI